MTNPPEVASISAAADDNADVDPPSTGRPAGLLSRIFPRVFGAPVSSTGAAPGGPNGANGPDASLLHGLGNLRALRVADVAIPRVEITAVPVDIDKDSLVETFRQSGNTRLPVYDDTLDLPLGLIHLKDFALTNGFNGGRAADLDTRSLIRPLLFAPPSMPIGVLLQKMQTDRSHMALVIDEYGGVDGLVTIEDLIEQVIGEIEDEHDVEEAALWTEEKPGCFLAFARTPLEEFEEAIGKQLAPEQDGDEIDTLGGLLFVEIGRVPARGEVVTLENGVQFEVVDADPRRIKRLRVRLPGAAIKAIGRTPSAPLSPSLATREAIVAGTRSA